MLKTFDVYSGEVRITDPCYTRGVHLDADGKLVSILTLKAKKGRWVAEVEKDERVYQDIISKLVCYYDEQQSELAGLSDMSSDFHKALAMMMAKDVEKVVENKTYVTVESGQVGIFDNKSFRDDKIASRATRVSDKIVCEDQPWYSICCDRVLSEDQWGSVPNGCVSSSAREGKVEVSTYTNASGELVKVEINFASQIQNGDSDGVEEIEESDEDSCDCHDCRIARGEDCDCEICES